MLATAGSLRTRSRAWHTLSPGGKARGRSTGRVLWRKNSCNTDDSRVVSTWGRAGHTGNKNKYSQWARKARNTASLPTPHTFRGILPSTQSSSRSTGVGEDVGGASPRPFLPTGQSRSSTSTIYRPQGQCPEGVRPCQQQGVLQKAGQKCSFHPFWLPLVSPNPSHFLHPVSHIMFATSRTQTAHAVSATGANSLSYFP